MGKSLQLSRLQILKLISRVNFISPEWWKCQKTSDSCKFNNSCSALERESKASSVFLCYLTKSSSGPSAGWVCATSHTCKHGPGPFPDCTWRRQQPELGSGKFLLHSARAPKPPTTRLHLNTQSDSQPSGTQSKCWLKLTTLQITFLKNSIINI